MPRFAALMREDGGAWVRLGEAERVRLTGLYRHWVGELRRQGVLIGGESLGPGGRIVRRIDGQVVESEYTETEQVESGWFVLLAPDLAAATRFARTCPALLHGETVVVRPLDEE